MRVLDLFSGIGGFSLGLERAGMETVAFCEISPFCRQVLAKHWPGVPIYDDVRTITAARLAADGVVLDIICGGFPCQDLSVAGKGAGLSGERSGLWFEFLRVIEETRPRWCIVENVPALRTRGLDTVLGGLAAISYDAEWHCIPAAALGAAHRRDRVWIVAYPSDRGRRRNMAQSEHEGRATGGLQGYGETGAKMGERPPSTVVRSSAGVAYPEAGGRRVNGHERGADGGTEAGQPAHCGEAMAYPSGQGLPSPEQPERREPIVTAADIGRAASECRWRRSEPGMGGEAAGVSAGLDGHRWTTPTKTLPGGTAEAFLERKRVANANGKSMGITLSDLGMQVNVDSRYPRAAEPWEGSTPRTVGRGLRNRRARLMALGNAVVPQVVELIGRAILGCGLEAEMDSLSGIVAAMGLLARDIAHLRAQLKKWTHVL